MNFHSPLTEENDTRVDYLLFFPKDNLYDTLLKFGNDQNPNIISYGDYQLGNVTISRVHYVEGLGHNLFSVGQFCDSDLEVAFRKLTCYVRNLDGADLLFGSRDTNLYTISLDDMLKTSPICLLSKASKTKRWLWHRRLSHLNFGTLNQLAKQGLVRSLPKLKIEKDHLCLTCSLGKSKKSSHKPKADDTNQEKLYLLHMDMCRPMRDEAPEVIIKCLKQIQVRLNDTVRNVRTDNGTEFVNQTLKDYHENVRISHQTSVARTLQQNGVVERQNCTLVEAARTMLIFLKAPLFLWAEAVQQHKPDLPFLHVFGSLCYSTNDSEDLGKLKLKANIDAPSASNPSTQEQDQSPIISQDVEESPKTPNFHNDPLHETLHEDSTSQGSSSNVRSPHTRLELLGKWTKNHPLENVIGDPSRSVSTRKQLKTNAM
ncbi:retrovirus-related pol polyprotein from transposon TNT 1-94 [Tanacetum coccineum]